MKVKIIKPTMVNGKKVEAGEEIELLTPVAKMLIGAKKAKVIEEPVELEVNIGLSPELQKKIDEIEEEYKKEIETLKETLKNREEEYKTLYEDIFSIPLKELREKYRDNP